MPNIRELTWMFQDIQRLVPAAVGAILAIVTAIGVLVPSLEGGSSSIGGANSGTTNSQGGYSKPEISGAKYLTDSPLTSGNGYKLKSGYGVTVNGKEYKKSILSTDGEGVDYRSYKSYNVSDTMRTLNLKAAWVDTIPNSGGVGKVTIDREGQLLDQFTVKTGEIVERNIDVRGGGNVRITLEAFSKRDQNRVPSSGLAVLTPVVK